MRVRAPFAPRNFPILVMLSFQRKKEEDEEYVCLACDHGACFQRFQLFIM